MPTHHHPAPPDDHEEFRREFRRLRAVGVNKISAAEIAWGLGRRARAARLARARTIRRAGRRKTCGCGRTLTASNYARHTRRCAPVDAGRAA